MNGLHSVFQNVAQAGNLYGWRMDAILLGGLLWILAIAAAELRSIF